MRRAVIAVTLSAMFSLAGPLAAVACQVEGWTVADAADRAQLIVEADVVRVLDPGYVLRVREVFKGTALGSSLRIGQHQTRNTGDCGGRINLDVGDHVVLALADSKTALAVETAVWWVNKDGSVDRANLFPNGKPTTIRAIRAALRATLPDTATVGHAIDRRPALPLVQWAAGAIALLAIMLRLARRPHHAGTTGSLANRAVAR